MFSKIASSLLSVTFVVEDNKTRKNELETEDCSYSTTGLWTELAATASIDCIRYRRLLSLPPIMPAPRPLARSCRAASRCCRRLLWRSVTWSQTWVGVSPAQFRCPRPRSALPALRPVLEWSDPSPRALASSSSLSGRRRTGHPASHHAAEFYLDNWWHSLSPRIERDSGGDRAGPNGEQDNAARYYRRPERGRLL